MVHKETSENDLIWEIWIEGYLCTGMEGIPATASYEGKWSGKTFKEACQAWCDANNERSAYFNPNQLTYWGCGLYDNESDARKAFG